MGLRITNACDYAIRAMLHLASLPEGGVALSDDVARAQDIPASFAAKILRRLARAELLRSSRGVRGGFTLARPASDISLLDIVEAIEGPLSITHCVPDADACHLSDNCPANGVWVQVQGAIAELLKAATLEEMVSAPRKNGRAVYTATVGSQRRELERSPSA
jgi:Rrf2 family protein